MQVASLLTTLSVRTETTTKWMSVQTCIVCIVKCEEQEQKQVARACHIPRK